MLTDTILVLILAGLSLILAWQGAWFYQKRDQGEGNRFNYWLNQNWLITFLQAVYFLGFPYLAIMLGLIPTRLFGLKGLNYLLLPTDFQFSAELGASLLTQFGNLLLVWLPDFGSIAYYGSIISLLFFTVAWFYMKASPYFSKDMGFPQIYVSLSEIIFDVIHWNFYRAVIWFVTGSLYLGVWGGAFIMLLEYAYLAKLSQSSTQRLQPLQSAQSAQLLHAQNPGQRYLIRFALGATTSFVFLTTPNLWLIILLQIYLTFLLAMLFNIFSRIVGSSGQAFR